MDVLLAHSCSSQVIGLQQTSFVWSQKLAFSRQAWYICHTKHTALLTSPSILKF